MANFLTRLFVIFFLLSFKAYSLESLKWYTEEYPPFNFRGKDKKRPSGISVEILESVHKRLKDKGQLGRKMLRKDYRLVPWKRAYMKVQRRGQKNVVFSTTRTEEREQKFKWFGPIAKNVNAIFALKGSKKLSKKDMVNEIRRNGIVSVRGDVAVDLVLRLGVRKSKINEVGRLEHAFGMVKKKRKRFFAYGTLTSYYKMKSAGIKVDDFEIVYSLGEVELWYAVNKSVSDRTVSTYQRVLEKVKREDSNLKNILLREFNLKIEDTLREKSSFARGKCPYKKIKCGEW
ncbi:MAG: transporter substrate-binding domain-containing protein [Bdellovibrionota bacterium]|nr:transporter substrate-binding domain-containing protein [Bdellovibrionota bacterium]